MESRSDGGRFLKSNLQFGLGILHVWDKFPSLCLCIFNLSFFLSVLSSFMHPSFCVLLLFLISFYASFLCILSSSLCFPPLSNLLSFLLVVILVPFFYLPPYFHHYVLLSSIHCVLCSYLPFLLPSALIILSFHFFCLLFPLHSPSTYPFIPSFHTSILPSLSCAFLFFCLYIVLPFDWNRKMFRTLLVSSSLIFCVINYGRVGFFLLLLFSAAEWSDEMRGKKCKRKNLLGRSDRKKKVSLVSGKKSKSYWPSSERTRSGRVKAPVSCFRAVYRLHVERHRHPGRLDRHQEGQKSTFSRSFF